MMHIRVPIFMYIYLLYVCYIMYVILMYWENGFRNSVNFLLKLKTKNRLYILIIIIYRYTAAVWWKTTEQLVVKQKLDNIRRLSCLNRVGCIIITLLSVSRVVLYEMGTVSIIRFVWMLAQWANARARAPDRILLNSEVESSIPDIYIDICISKFSLFFIRLII